MEKNYQQLRFGGLKWGAAFFGWLVTAAIANLLLGLATAIAGATAVNLRLDTTHLGMVGLWGALIILAVWVLAFYAGGYVAGRMTRFDGGRQGFGVWAVNLIVTLVFSLVALIFGPVLNLLPIINLPHLPIGEGSVAAVSALILLVTFVLTALSAVAGGKAGQLYHHRIDDTVLAAGYASSRSTETTPKPNSTAAEPGTTTSNRYAPTFGERIEQPRDPANQGPR